MSSLANGDLLIEYDNRQEAETAMTRGKTYEGHNMTFEWYNNNNNNNNNMQSQSQKSNDNNMNVDM